MTRRMTMAVLCAAAAACGRSSGSGGDAAASNQSNYGPPTPASSSQVAAIEGALSSALAFQGSPPSYENAMGAAMVMNTSGALLGSPTEFLSPAGTSGSAEQRALVKAMSAALLSPDFGTTCVAVTSTSVTFTNCTIPVSVSADGVTVTGSATADGSVMLINTNQALTWDLTISTELNVSTSVGSGSGGGSLHTAGTLNVTLPAGSAEGTIVGNETAELNLHASAGGQSFSIGVNDSLDLDLTFQTSTGFCITGGTLEENRVWTDWSVPGNFPRPSDGGALVTFSGCNAATAQLSN